MAATAGEGNARTSALTPEKDQSLVKLPVGPTAIQSGGQCWSDEALLYQVRRNGEAGARTTKIKVCVSCRALWARSTAMKCLVGETALGPAAERGDAHHQKCVRIRLLFAISDCHCAAHCVPSPMPGAEEGGR